MYGKFVRIHKCFIYMSKPNLFQIATKELSQDGFIAWLLQWADPSNIEHDAELCHSAQSFVRFLLGQDESYSITSVEAGRQWEHIDIWAVVNDTEAIIIEDKIGTGEHSDQLTRYRDFALDFYSEKGVNLHCIYLKTGNESLDRINAVKEKGYIPISRTAFLNCLEKNIVKNDIYREYVASLRRIENETNDCLSVERIHNNWYSSEGFFLRLQNELLPQWSDWRYVPNASGGFQGFWYHWTSSVDFPEIYIQIENSTQEIKLVVKVAGNEVSTEQLYEALPHIQRIGLTHNIRLEKPRRFRAGETATLAVVTDAFDPETFSLNGFIEVLRRLELVIDDYAEEFPSAE